MFHETITKVGPIVGKSALSLTPVSFTSNQSLQQIHPTDSHLNSSTSFYCHGHHHNFRATNIRLLYDSKGPPSIPIQSIPHTSAKIFIQKKCNWFLLFLCIESSHGSPFSLGKCSNSFLGFTRSSWTGFYLPLNNIYYPRATLNSIL